MEKITSSSLIGNTIITSLIEERLTSKKVSEKIAKDLFPSSFTEEEINLIKLYCNVYHIHLEVCKHCLKLTWNNNTGYLKPTLDWVFEINPGKETYQKLTYVRNKISKAFNAIKRGSLHGIESDQFNKKIYLNHSIFHDFSPASQNETIKSEFLKIAYDTIK